MEIWYYESASWTEVGAIVGYPTITEKNNMYNTCIVTIRDYEGALYASWEPRDFTPIIICEEYADSTFTNIIFQGFVINKKFSAKAMVLYIAGFSIMLDWIPFDVNYILAQGKIKSDPIPANATLEVYDDENENNQYDDGESFSWDVDQWIGGSRDNGLLIVDNTSGTTSKVWSCDSILSTAMDNWAGNCASLATRDDDDEYYAYETDNSDLEYLDGDIKVTMTGTQIADSNYLQKIELDIKFGIRLVGDDDDVTHAAVSVELIPEYNGAFNNTPIAILKHHDLTYLGGGGYDSEKWFSGKLVIEGTNAELAKYLTKDGANYDHTRFQLKFGIYNKGVQSWMNGDDDKWCYIYIDYASLEIFYNTLDVQPIMASITDSAASTLTCAGVDWSITGVATNDIFYIGENTNQILSDLDGLLGPIEIEVGSTLSKYIATHFKGITCMEVLKAICNLEGLIWCEDHEELKIKVLKPADFVDSEVDLDQDDYEDDWEFEDKCNQIRRVDVYGRASYNIHAIAIDTTVSGYQSKILIDETIMTQSIAQEVADTQLDLYKDKRPSVRIPLDGYRTDLKLGYTVDITMSRPTIAKAAYPIRMIERHRRGIAGIQTIVYAGLGESSWDEIIAKQIRENTNTAHRTQSDRLISTPWSAGANISYGDVVGFGTGVRDIIDAEIVDGESIDAAIDALIATHHDAASVDHDDRYYTEAETDAFLLNKWGAPDGNIDMNSKKFTSLIDPANNQDSATKKYVDDKISDAAYDGDLWNGVDTIAPSKNAVRDVIEPLVVCLNYKGTWTPGVGYPADPETGDYWIVDTDAIEPADSVVYEVGDWIVYNGVSWDHIRTSKGDNVFVISPGDNIQTAIDEIESIGNGAIFLEPGTHTLTATLTINDANVYINVYGVKDGTVIDCGGDRGAFDISNCKYCILQNFKIDSSDISTVGEKIIEINETNDNKVQIIDVNIVGDADQKGIGLDILSNNVEIIGCDVSYVWEGISLSTSINSIITRCKCHHNDYGLLVAAANGINNIFGNYVYSNDIEGLYIVGSNYANVYGNYIYSNTDDGMLVSSADYNFIHGNYLYNNGGYGINLAANAENNNYAGNQYYNNTNGATNDAGSGNIGDPTHMEYDTEDPAAIDILVGNFTIDASWHEIDLDTYKTVPDDAIGFFGRCYARSTSGGDRVRFRSTSQANTAQVAEVYLDTANEYRQNYFPIPLDSNHKFDYYASNNVNDMAVQVLWWIRQPSIG